MATLNAKTVAATVKKADKPITLTDGTGERGAGRLALRVRPFPTGNRGDWLAIWWTAGRRRVAVIGRYPDLSLSEARDIFRDRYRPAILKGTDPRHSRRKAAKAGSVADLFAAYVEDMKTKGRQSWPEVERALLAAADNIGADTKAAAVTPDAIAAYLAGVYSRGAKTAADRYRAYLRAAFQWGVKADRDYTRPDKAAHFGIGYNPVDGVPRDQSANTARDRALNAGELATLWRDISNHADPKTAAAVRLLICTGARVREVLRAERADFSGGVWTIPDHKSKTGRGRVVPLTDQAVEAVDLAARASTGALLFPNERNKAEPMPHQSINRALKRWTERARLEPFQARDLRRTFTTLATDAGLSREARNLIQGHNLNGVDYRHYNRSDYLSITAPQIKIWQSFLGRVTEN